MSFLLWLVLGRESPHRGRKRVGMAFICAIKEIRHFYGNVLIVCRPSLSLYCDYRTWTNSRDTGFYYAKSTQKAATGTHSHCADADYFKGNCPRRLHCLPSNKLSFRLDGSPKRIPRSPPDPFVAKDFVRLC